MWSGVRIQACAREFFVLETVQTGSGPTNSPVSWLPKCEFDQLTPSSAKVKNEWSYTSTSPLCVHDVDRGSFTFYLYIMMFNHYFMRIPVAARSKEEVCGRSPAEIAGSNHTGVGGDGCVCCECCVLSGHCDMLISRPEESYRLWCVVECDLETS